VGLAALLEDRDRLLEVRLCRVGPTRASTPRQPETVR
jgi:hypothetical protein